MTSYLAVDLGAESGRVMLGELDRGRLALREVSRFENRMLRLRGVLHWNTARIYEEILFGFTRAARAAHPPGSLGVDSWGVDFALLDALGDPLGLPVAYRDNRTHGAMLRFFERVPRAEIYRRTGIQFIQFNTLYQLFALSQQKSPQLEAAARLLLIPDFFHYLFTGRAAAEYTNATTTQMFNAHEGRWDKGLVRAAGASVSMLPEIVPPGTALGPLDARIARDTGLNAVPVIAPATHDTASAVAAAPARGGDWAYISSGTWSLMGVETQKPMTTDAALAHNFTNEGGVDGTIRLLKNIMGLWLVQRLRAGFNKKYDYGQLTAAAEDAPAFQCIVDPDDTRFLNPTDMTAAFAAFCRETHQPAPDTAGAFVRCALQSLALRYRAVLGEIVSLTGRPIARIHVIGGGSQNRLLNQMAADACGVPVIAGPVEAAAAGNALMQARALGHVRSLGHAREIVAASFPLETFEPRDTPAWDAVFEKFKELSKSN